MSKNSIILLLGTVVIFLLFYALYHKGNVIDTTPHLKSTLSKLEHDVNVLRIRDDAWSKHVELITDSLETERKNVAYWKLKYREPINVTKEDVKQVFKQDSTTITEEVKKGVICDSLQNKQAIEIETLNHAMAGTDSLIFIKTSEILKLRGIDSTHLKIESNLQKKVKKHKVAEVAVAVVAILALILH